MDILNILNDNYAMRFNRFELIRDMGSKAYVVFLDNRKYFFRVIKPAFFDTAITGVNVQVFLQNQGFPVPPVIYTKDNFPYVRMDNSLYILYEFIEGEEVNPEQDAKEIGALVGRLHFTMKEYHGELVKRDRYFFIGRYIDILRKKQYPKVEDFSAYGNELWEKVRNLPRGFCHGDMYRGNIHKTPEGKLYLLDFDTSCEGFPMYDPTLICDMTRYFHFEDRNFSRSNEVLTRFLPEYLKYNDLSQNEINAFYDLIAIQHFATQATVMEIFGPDCLDATDLDNQLDWLYRWRKQCDESGV